MKFLKVSFLAVVALIAMSFTYVSNQDFVEDREQVSNCYQAVSNVQYLVCPSWSTLPSNCNDAQAAEGRYVRNNASFSATNHTTSPIECDGGTVICCVKFQAVTTGESCVTDEKLGDVNANGQLVAGTKFIKILDIYCKPL